MYALFAIIRNDFDYLHAFPIWPYLCAWILRDLQNVTDIRPLGWTFLRNIEARAALTQLVPDNQSVISQQKLPRPDQKNGSSDKRCLGGLPGHKMPLRSAYINMVRLKSWACLFSISIPRFSVTLFPYQFAGQLRFLLPVPCLPGSQWNWRFLRNNLKKTINPLYLCGNQP